MSEGEQPDVQDSALMHQMLRQIISAWIAVKGCVRSRERIAWIMILLGFFFSRYCDFLQSYMWYHIITVFVRKSSTIIMRQRPMPRSRAAG